MITSASNTGREFIGIEMDDKYFEIAKNRIAACVPANDNNQA